MAAGIPRTLLPPIVLQKYAQNLNFIVTLATIFSNGMKKSLLILTAFWMALGLKAQESTSAYNVLKFPASAHVTALGGENISLVEDAPAAGWANPALYSGVSDRSLGLNFMTYAGGSKWLGAQFVKAFGDRHTGAASVQYMGYGSMDETDEAGNVLGSFSPKDIVLNVGYSYLFSDRWAGGAALKGIYSKYADFSAFAVAVDLGLNYYDEDADFSLSTVVQNVGTQLKSFDDRAAHLPFGLQIGFTKGMNHAPVRFSLTMTDITRWKSSYYFNPDGGSVGFSKKLLNHFVVGVDILPTSYIYLSAGYNFRRAYELKAAGSGHGAGLTFGGGFDVKRFKAGVSYAKYHLSMSSLMFNVAYSL